MTGNEPDPVPVRPSATVVLIREGATDPEILMIRRRAGDAFGDSYAFPGGVLDQDEPNARAFCQGLTTEQADAALELPGGGLEYYSAAIRELFEETGILLARDSERNWAFAANPESASLIQDLRTKLHQGSMPWAEILRLHELHIACDALHYFGYWETPICRPKRWTTRFFLARVPPGQDALHDGTEVTDSCWMSAVDVLSVGKERGMPLPFPTLVNLKKFSEFRTIDELTHWAGKQVANGIRKIRPVILTENGKMRFVIPGDANYPE